MKKLAVGHGEYTMIEEKAWRLNLNDRKMQETTAD